MNKQEYQGRLLQVFRYLQSYHSLKNPVKKMITEHEWYLWLDTLPEDETVIWNAFDPDLDTDSNDADFIVKIRRPELIACPEPPLKILAWLEEGWRAPDQPVRLKPTKEARWATGLNAEPATPEKFEASAERVRLYQQWETKRSLWCEKQLKAYQILTIYEKLYNLYSQMKREAERVELVLADGILKAVTDRGEAIQYPLLFQPIELIFDSEVPEFAIRQSDQKPEFNSDLLRQVSKVNTDAIGECREEFDAQIAFLYDNDEKLNAFLHRISARLQSGGRFTADFNEYNRINQALVIGRRPVLLLRNRTTGFFSFIDQVLGEIETATELPTSLANILGFETAQLPAAPTDSSDFLAVNGESEKVLFSKEANLEQLQIVQKLERSGAVLVQGPPGTGKTHTIANLIGHFLAQGKTVLVTSHTSKALRVLKEKIVPSLQALCVTVFNDDREQLERCVDAITEYIAAHHSEALEKEAGQLQTVRSELLTRLWEYKRRLLDQRKGEYRPVVIGGRDYQVKEAALLVASQQRGNDWIPAPVALGAVLPLAPAEVRRLYQTNLSVTQEDEKELKAVMPDLAELIAPVELEQLAAEIKRCNSAESQYKADYWEPGYEIEPEYLKALLNQVRKALSELNGAGEWEKSALAAGFMDNNYRKPWESLVENIRLVFEKNAAFQTVVIDYEPVIPAELINEATRDRLVAMIEHLQNGKKFGFLTYLQHSGWKETLAKVKIQGGTPITVEHFEYLLQGIQLELDREVLKKRWHKLVTAAGGPRVDEFGCNPEKGMWQYVEKITGLIDWYRKQWHPLEKQFEQIGFDWGRFLQEQPVLPHDESGLERFSVACRDLEQVFGAMQNRLRAAALNTQIDFILVLLDRHIDSTESTRTLRNLRQALAAQDLAQYREAYERLVELANKQADLQLRQEYLSQLLPVAPAWAAAIRDRQGVHGRAEAPGDPETAWEWRQLHDELELRNQENLERLQREIDELNQQLRQVTVRLIEKKTWAKICSTSIAQRQALVGWKELVKKMGKRTGKRVPIYLEEARKLMPQCQAAVPVWIMPLIRVAENFSPRENKFDVVIIDEASQSDPLALTALYLGKQVIVVGDDQQVSPDAVGQDQEAIQNLINEYLTGIPNRQLYDGQSSVYDLAKCSFEPVCLKEHFRCVAPIIEFSNRLSYDGRIKPLRDASEVMIKPPTVAYHVSNGRIKHKTNQAEAETTAALIAACIEQPEYGGATFGVISLLGTEQALLVDSILRRRLPEKEYAKRQILCGNPAQFQGDERDVIFISIVDTAKEEGPLTLRSFGARDMYRKRYNVAASRARDQMWVIHSLDLEVDLKPDDLRLRLINHALNPESLLDRYHQAQAKAESEFERLVIKALINQGYQVVPQWKVGSYRIDIVVLGKEQKIAVECDGERYHTDENLAQDMARQAILERLGWRFIRIRGSRYFRDPEATMAEVFARLTEYEILPEYHEPTATSSGQELLDRVIRRADQIRREWTGLPGGPVVTG